MTKKMEEHIINTLEEGLSMAGMNFAATGFSWAEDLYQKWENICQNNILVQEPSKIVDAVGVQVRKIYEEVTDDWLNPFSVGCDKGPVSNLSLEQDVTADFCKESRTSHDKEPMNEESLICPMSALAIDSKEIKNVPLPDAENDERKKACDLFSIGCDKALVSDLSLEQVLTADVCEESRTSHDEEPICEGSLVCPMSALAIASKEIKAFPFSDVEKDEEKEACDLFSIGCDKTLVSDLSLEQDVMADVCEESGTSPDKEPIHEGSLICTVSALAIASTEIKIVQLPDIEKIERKETCELFDKEIACIPPEANLCGCSSEIRYNSGEISNLSTSTSHSCSLPAADKICLSDLSFEQDVMADVCEESRTSHDEEPICEVSLIFPMSALAIASKEIKVVPLPDIKKDERKDACDCELFDKEIAHTLPEANLCGCSSEIRYNNYEFSNSSTFTCRSGSLPPADNICLSVLPERNVEREFMLSHVADPTEEYGNCDFIDYSLSFIRSSILIDTFEGNFTSQEGISFVESFLSVHEKTSSLSELETSLSLTDVGSSYCFNGDKTLYSVIVDKKLESIEEFEDVSLEDFLDEKTLDDCWKEAETYELALISYRATRNRSYKKKLRDAFTSRFCSLKKNNVRGACLSGDIRAELAKIGITSPSLEAGILKPVTC